MKLDDFYLETDYYFDVDRFGLRGNSVNLNDIYKEIEGSNINRMQFGYIFRGFKYALNGKIENDSSFNVNFKETTYTIHNTNNQLLLTNPYHIQLTNEEISLMINEEVRRHLEFIKESSRDIEK